MLKNKVLALALAVVLTGSVAVCGAGGRDGKKTLDIYFVDVEGGAATLIVTPAGESILVDAGWPGFGGRDAKRIVAAMREAGITEIDHMIDTHYHVDHYGGIPALAALVPIKHFYDHGKRDHLDEDGQFPKLYAAYQAATKGQSTTLRPGDRIPLKSEPGTPALNLLVLSGNGDVIGGQSTPENSECARNQPKPADPTDNARSLGFVLSFGSFRFLDLGDLTWNNEYRLVCPVNRIGHIDLYQVTHHGFNISNNPVLLHSVSPTVAIMDNGPRKGGTPDAVKWVTETPSVQDLYQLHRNVQTSPQQNTSPDLIANLDETPDAGNMISVSVDPDSHKFTVTNERTGASTSFAFK